MGGWDESWRDFKPPERGAAAPVAPAAPNPPTKTMDRGRRQGAKWCVVVGETLYEKATAEAHGLKGILFRSRKEAKRWVYLLAAQRHGQIRNLRRQVRYPLQARNPAGLMVTVCTYVADHVFDERSGDAWVEVVEDVKPGGFRNVKGKKVPFREEIYSLKRKWFQAQYGREIRET